MYLNYLNGKLASIQGRLTLTWDVFKSVKNGR